MSRDLIAVIADIIRTTSRDPNVTFEEDAATVLDALCPPGGRVVVDRTAKPCDECDGHGWVPVMGQSSEHGADECDACGGSGVVEATTTYGLEELSIYQAYGSLGKGPTGPDYVKYVYGDVMHPTYEDGGWQPAGYETPLFRLVAVALPEETPQ